MERTSIVKTVGLFILFVIVDITLIQLFRFITPLIVILRLGIYFLVIAGSIYLYYVIIKPKNPIKLGIIFSIICFAIALLEAFIVHIVIEGGQFELIYLIPSSFALILPFIIAVIYKRVSTSKEYKI